MHASPNCSITAKLCLPTLQQQEKGGIGKSIPDDPEKSRGSREISRAGGIYFPIPPKFWWSTDILLIINPSTGMDQGIHTCGQGRIDSVKINPSLLRMRECVVFFIEPTTQKTVYIGQKTLVMVRFYKDVM